MTCFLEICRREHARLIAEHRDLCARGELKGYDTRLILIGVSAVALDALEEEEREYETRALSVAAVGLDPMGAA